MVRMTRLVVARGLANVPLETLPTKRPRDKKQKDAAKAMKPPKTINENKAVSSKGLVESPAIPIRTSAKISSVTMAIEIPAKKPDKEWVEVIWSQTEKTTATSTTKSPVKTTIKTFIRSPAKTTLKIPTRSPAKDTEKTTNQSSAQSAEILANSSISIPIHPL